MPIIVKICGMTSFADAEAAVAAGADALGFVFYKKSPRWVAPEIAAEIARAVPARVLKVGVFVDPTREEVLEAARNCRLDLLQFHGQETPEFCLSFGARSMKAFRIRDEQSLAGLPNYRTDAWLLDAYTEEALGGTGARFNWDLAIRARDLGRPIFLAGGLTPVNVRDAVTRVRPYGVDVSSGVETSPGRKDREKMRVFIAEVRDANRPAAGKTH